MQEKLEGIIVREMNYGDTSKIIELFTKEYGLISLIAKGAKQYKSNLSSVTSNLTYGVFQIYYKKDKLSVLTYCDVIKSLKNIKTDIKKISYVSYIVDILKQVLKQVSSSNDIVEIYNIFIATILKIEENFDILVLKNIFELKMLKYLGVSFDFDSCSICGNQNFIVTFSVDSNGFVCKKCKTNEKIVNIDSIKFLRMYYYLDVSKISKLNVDFQITKEIDYFLSEYYSKHTGLYLNSKKFIDVINKLNLD